MQEIRQLQLKDTNLAAIIVYLEKDEFPEEEKAAKRLILESKSYKMVVQFQQSGALLYLRKNSLNCCKNIMEADLLDTLLSRKCTTLSDNNTGGKACGLMFDTIVVHA